jgi:hypothetical protein
MQMSLADVPAFVQLEGTGIHDICNFMRSFDTNGDGEVDLPEFRVMLQSAWTAARLFTGSEQADFLTDRQLDALLLYDWPSKNNSSTDTEQHFGLGGLLSQMQKEQELFIQTAAQDTKDRAHRLDREQQVEAGNRDDSRLLALEDLLSDLRELHDSGKLGHYQTWKKDLIEAEETYIQNPSALDVCVRRIKVKMLEREQKQVEVAKLAHNLCKSGITAIPPQIWDDSTNFDPANPPSEEHRIVRRLGFVVLTYRVEYWWWETTEMLRKFLMTSLLIFIYPDDPAQMAAGVMITFCFLLLNMIFRPFCNPTLNALQSFTMITQFLTLLVGIMLALSDLQRQQSTRESSRTDTGVVSVLIILINCSTLVFPFVRLALNGGLADYYQKAVGCHEKFLGYLCFLKRVLFCEICGPKPPQAKTPSLRSRLISDQNDHKDATRKPIKWYQAGKNIENVLGLTWSRNDSSHRMPPIVQQARIFTGILFSCCCFTYPIFST